MGEERSDLFRQLRENVNSQSFDYNMEDESLVPIIDYQIPANNRLSSSC